MNLEIVDQGDKGYTLMLDGSFFRHCKTYAELTQSVGGLVQSRFLQNAEGFI